MGTDKFAKMVFDKVFTDDIERLRSMEDMWKNKGRSAPVPLSFEELSKASSKINVSIARQDQRAWTLEETFAVFVDSVKRLSDRLQEQKANNAADGSPPVLTFDKDDDDTLDFVAASASLRSHIFGIQARSKFDIKQMAGNIIPAIATTNAMAASLSVLQAFKVLKDELPKARNVFLARSAERIVSSEPLRPPKPNCPVCGVAQAKLIVDPERATLNDLVDGILKLELGYGEEFSIASEAGVVYDPELDDNLPKKFGDLGIKADSFITVVDEEDDNPRVNLVFSISEKYVSNFDICLLSIC
jgi:ubiquitin-like 1-activating enzyme E1 B